jgi:hypothetical protein
MSIGISFNICRDTATSASWKVTYRPWLMTLVPILISFSRTLGQRLRFRRVGHRQCPHEIAEVVGERMELKADSVRGEETA